MSSRIKVIISGIASSAYIIKRNSPTYPLIKISGQILFLCTDTICLPDSTERFINFAFKQTFFNIVRLNFIIRSQKLFLKFHVLYSISDHILLHDIKVKKFCHQLPPVDKTQVATQCHNILYIYIYRTHPQPYDT